MTKAKRTMFGGQDDGREIECDAPTLRIPRPRVTAASSLLDENAAPDLECSFEIEEYDAAWLIHDYGDDGVRAKKVWKKRDE